jgi:hypothetical protein
MIGGVMILLLKHKKFWIQIIGIKRMGEAETGPFEDACLHGFSEDYEEKSTRICSWLQHDVTNPMWHPFKKEFVDGKFKYFLILIFIYKLFSPCQSC